MSVITQDSSIPISATGNVYDKYRVESIRLLNELMKCPKEPATGSGSKSNPDISRVIIGTDTKPEPNKSSTPLQHNGNVGSLEDLILFLIKSPTTPPIKMKLNDVYKIFNPSARDIVSNRSIPTSIPKPTPPPESIPIVLDPVAT